MPFTGMVYTSAFNALYFPARELLRPAVRALPVGGVGIDAVADLIAVTGENALVVGGWLAFRRRRNEERARANT
jgi:2-keto-3-deoxy-6-phosphogluconate aldolase